MATVYPTAAGNWSTRTWNDDATGAAYGPGTPQTGDTVLLNNLTITVDQDITVVEVSNRAGTTAASGGTLSVTNASNGFSLNANVVTGPIPSNTCVTCTLTAPNTFTVNGNITGGSTNSRGLILSTTGIVTINGNVTGGIATSAQGVLLSASSGTITINGDVTGGSGANGAYNDTALGMMTINGSAIAVNGSGSNVTLMAGVFSSRAIVGYTRIASSVSAPNGNAGHAGTVTFIDPNTATIKIRDTSLTEHTLQKSSGGGGGYPRHPLELTLES